MSVEALVSIATAVIIGANGLFWFVVKNSITAQIKEKISWETKRREQAAGIAELFSLHHKWKYFPDEQEACKYELQKKYWELSIWLDAEIFRAVNEAFEQAALHNDEMAHKRAMVVARKHIVGYDDNVSPEEITHWLSNIEENVLRLQKELAQTDKEQD